MDSALALSSSSLALLPVLAQEVARLTQEAIKRDRPIFLHMLGVPGAGKSTFVNALLPLLSERRPTLVDFDRLMKTIPDYHALPDREEAFRRYELPAREAGYRLLDNLIDKRADILLDHGGLSVDHRKMLARARQTKGYRAIVVHCAVDPETARQRLVRRSDLDGRHTPLNYVDERYAALEGLKKGYKALADNYIEIPNDVHVNDHRNIFNDVCSRIALIWGNGVF